MNLTFTNPRTGEYIIAYSPKEVEAFRSLGWLEEKANTDFLYFDNDVPPFSSPNDENGEREPSDYYSDLTHYGQQLYKEAFINHFFQWHSVRMRQHLIQLATLNKWKDIELQLTPYIHDLRRERSEIYF